MTGSDLAGTYRPARLRAVLLTALAGLPILIAAIGALAVRPIADDYAVEGTLSSAGSVSAAFSYWMHEWSAFYSMYGLLTAGAATGRHVGLAVYYPAAALAVLALLVASSWLVTRAWSRLTGVRVSAAGTALLASVVLGGLFSLVRPAAPVLFGAIYWQTAFLPHVVPVLLVPLVLAGLLRLARLPRRWLAVLVAVIAGFVLAGFAFAETMIVMSATVATAWAIRRLRGPQASRPAVGVLAAMVLGLVIGFVTVYLLPGTSVRQADLANQGIGIRAVHGFMPWLQLIGAAIKTSLAWPVLSPALVLGLAAGWIVRRGLVTPAVSTDEERTVIRVVGTALGATVVASWIVTVLGDIASYPAWWHCLPLWIELVLVGALVGWWLAARRLGPAGGHRSAAAERRGYLRQAVPVVVVLWCVSVTALAAAATWDRHSIVDADVAAAQARAAGTTTGPVVWQSQSMADICDMERDWVQDSIAQWFGLQRTDFQVVIRHWRGATPGACG
jgi:hypothetical protein